MKKLILISFISFISYASNIDYEALDLSKDYSFNPQQITTDDFIDFNPADLRAELNVGAKCGQLDFGANFAAGMENAIKALASKEFIMNAMKAAPMLAACSDKFGDPALCAAIQNLNQMGSFIANFSLKQCELIDRYTSQQAQKYKESMSQCVGNHRSKGKSFVEARKSCTKTVTDKIASITSNSEYVGSVNIVEDTFKFLGLNDQSKLNNAKRFVGETSIKSGAITVSHGTKNGNSTSLLNEQNKDIKEATEKLCKLQDLENLNKNIKKDPKLKKDILSYFPENLISRISNMNNFLAQSYCLRTIKSAYQEKYLRDASEIYSTLAMGMMNPNLTESNKELLKDKVKALESYLKIVSLSRFQRPHELQQEIELEITSYTDKIEKRGKVVLKNKKIENSINNNIPEECIYSADCDVQ